MRVTHGRSMYVRGCRCPECREASATYSRQRRIALRRGITHEVVVRERLDLTPSVQIPDSWVADAACAGMVDEFVASFSGLKRRERSTLVRVAKAKQVCATCPVIDECREWAMTDPEPAYELVAGGLDPLERAQIRRQRRVAG